MFWDSSIDEISDMMESYRRTYTNKMKEKILLNQTLAIQIRQEITPLLVEEIPEEYKHKYVWDLFPDLFKEEYEEYSKIQEENELEEFKEKRRAFARKVEIKRGGK